MKFWLVLLTIVSVGAACAAEPDAQSLTLAEAVRIAIEHHPDVGKAKASADALKGKIREVRAQALPDVTINSMGLRLRDPSMMNASGYDQFPAEFKAALKPRGVNLFDYRVTVKQPLFTAGKVGTALRLASVEAEGALAEIDRAEQDLAMEVVRAWYGLMWAERYRGLVAETQQQKERHADMARTRFDNGVATEVDVLRSLVAVANGKPDLVRAENAIRQARAQLNYYLARPIGSPTRVTGDFEEKALETTDLAAMAEEALRRRPEVQRLRIAERSAGVQLQLAHAENRMRADMTANYGLAARLPSNLVNPDFKRWDFTVNFTLPVFDGFKRSGLVVQAVAAQRAARLEREKLEQQVRLTLQQAYDDLAAARETVTAAQATIREADRVLEMTQSNYKYGAATTLDIVDAQTAVTVARTNLLKGLHDYSLARANLRWVMGEKPWE
jgi:outer membrane protein TolC